MCPFTSTHIGDLAPEPEPEPQSKWSRRFFYDLGERALSTFLQALIPAAVAAGNLAHFDWLNAVELAGSAAGIALLKGLAANAGNSETGASLLPTSPPGPEVNPDADQPQDDWGH